MTSPAGNVRVIVSVENNGVDVMKVTVADAPAPTAVLIVRAVAGAAVTAPTAGMPAKAVTQQLPVKQCMPQEHRCQQQQNTKTITREYQGCQ